MNQKQTERFIELMKTQPVITSRKRGDGQNNLGLQSHCAGSWVAYLVGWRTGEGAISTFLRDNFGMMIWQCYKMFDLYDFQSETMAEGHQKIEEWLRAGGKVIS
jgi:hypothetical protein